MTGKIITIANEKGGVAKTTTVYNLGAYLARRGKRVLFIDFDPQASLTTVCGYDPAELPNGGVGTHTLIAKEQPKVAPLPVAVVEGLFIVPATLDLAPLEIDLSMRLDPNNVLKNALKQYQDSFDFILVDTQPSFGRLPLNALVAARYLIIPTTCQMFAIKGLQLLQKTVGEVLSINPSLQLLALIPTIYDARRGQEQALLQTLQRQWGNVCMPPVPDKAEYINAVGENRPVNGDQRDYWFNLADYVIREAIGG